MQFHKNFFIFSLLCTALVSFTDNKKQEFLYDQLLPKVVTLDVENPTEQALHIINMGQAYLQGGTKFKPAVTEIWQAICSIDLFTILEQYMPTYTASGKIALGRLASFINDDFTILQSKVDLQKYFRQNPQVYRTFEQIIHSAQQAEKAYGNLFRSISDEEKTEQETEDAQLYFSSDYGLDRFNENEWAVGAGPRLNQIHTTAWYTVPPIFVSAIYNQIRLGQKVQDGIDQYKFLEKSGATSFEEYKKSLDQEKSVLEKDYKNLENLAKTSPFFANAQRLNLYSHKKAIASCDVSENEFNEIVKTKDEYSKSKEKDLINFFCKKYKIGEQNIALCDTIDETSKRYKDGVSFIDKINILGRIIYNGTTNLPRTIYDSTSKTYELTKEEVVNGSYVRNPIKALCSDDSKFLLYSKIGGVYSAIAGAMVVYPMILYLRYNKTKTLFDLIYKKQEELHHVSQLVVTLEQLHSALQEDNHLQKILAVDLQQLSELFNPKSKTTSADLKLLIEKLNSNSFIQDPSYFISQPGKILATHKLLVRVKHELVPFIEVMGNIDAYLAIHKAYRQFENHPRVKFCLPEFINSATPVLDISEYWHPLINPNMVVTNSLNMGNGAKNLMITGPNAGGKTTSLMSLMINIIFAQSFGIAPSAKLVMTPFAKIHSYLDITTDLQQGLSLFAAEVDRAKKLKNSILSCTGNQKTFTIIDEIFSGTNPDVASDVGSKFATQLGDITHSMTIITTHFPALTKVGQSTGTFTNYKVADATIMPDGKIVYPFKLVPGISSQNIAQHMLEQQNII